MRILGWMHRKLRQNSSDPLKDFNIGRASLDECKPQLSRAASNQKDRYADYLKPFTGVDGTKDDEEETLSDLFTHWHNGLLAIGTLGTDPVEPGPLFEKEPEEPPQAAIGHLEKVAEEETTEDEGSEGCQVNTKLKDLTVDDLGHTTAQIQDPWVDVFGSRAEVADNSTVKKEHRISLGELFSKSKPADEGEQLENKARKIEGVKAVHLVKKILKRRTGSSKHSGSADIVAAENKIHKLFHMFNRKVHPSECYVTTKKCTKEDFKHTKDTDMPDDKDTVIHVDSVTGKEKIRRYKSQSIPPSFTICGSDSNGNREYWIKTDADYLVLEL